MFLFLQKIFCIYTLLLLPLFGIWCPIHGMVQKLCGQLFGIAIDVHAPDQELAGVCEQINKNSIGSVLIVGDIREVRPPGVDPRGTLAQWVHVVNTILCTCHPRPLILADFENGACMRLSDAPFLPRALTCGAIADEQLIFAYGREIGRQCQLLGVDINLAPDLDANTNRLNPIIHERSFGSNPERVARDGCAYIRGLSCYNVLACGKHFPGHGDTKIDTHFGLPVVNHELKRLHNVELYPFVCAIKAHVPCIMSVHIRVPALDPDGYCATVSHKILTDILREQVGFQGLVISDALRMRALTNKFDADEIIVRAFQAGNDLLLFPADIDRAVRALMHACETGVIAPADVHARAEKIKDLKQKLEIEKKAVLADAYDIKQKLETLDFGVLRKNLYRAAITCVRDEAALLRSLSTKKMACVTVGASVHNVVAVRMRELGVELETFDFAQMDPTKLLLSLADYEAVWVFVYDIVKFDFRTYGIAPTVHTFLSALAERNKRYGVVLFGTPYTAYVFKYAPTVLIAYDETPAAQSAVAEILAGQQKPIGCMPVNLD